MRIRKRPVPLPLSSLSPVPLSDLRLDASPPPVQLLSSPPPPLDHPNQRLSLIRRHSGGAHPPGCSLVELEKDEERSMKKKSNDSNSSSNDHEIWCDGDKTFPLKKRRGISFSSDVVMVDSKMKTKMKNKVCDLDHTKSKSGGDSGVRMGVLMEGSRCSRVNGRGWRCCQQTLVGYSLCEHHLGKGRLRSMSGTIRTPKKKKNATIERDHGMVDRKVVSLQNELKLEFSEEPVSRFMCDDDDDEDEEEKEKSSLAMTNKKRMKVGMVKARSMSSLLGQPHPVNNIT